MSERVPTHSDITKKPALWRVFSFWHLEEDGHERIEFGDHQTYLTLVSNVRRMPG